MMLQLISRLYLDTGLLTWNGNGISGNDRIQKFYIELPSSDHSISTLDAQPILGINLIIPQLLILK